MRRRALLGTLILLAVVTSAKAQRPAQLDPSSTSGYTFTRYYRPVFQVGDPLAEVADPVDLQQQGTGQRRLSGIIQVPTVCPRQGIVQVQNVSPAQASQLPPADPEDKEAPAAPTANPDAAAPPGALFSYTASPYSGGILAGAGFYHIMPVFGSNPALVSTTTFTGTGTSTTTTAARDFDWNFVVAPRVWLGYVFDHGWGFMASYWRFNDSANGIAVTHPADVASTVATVGALPIVSGPLVAPSAADIINVTSGLRLNVYDFEVVYAGTADRFFYRATAGARYAQLLQTYNATLVNPGNPAAGFTPVFHQENQANNFHGAGPTMSGELLYRILGGLCLYSNARFSLLLGRSKEDASQLFLGGFPATQNFSASGARDTLLPVGEVELGAGWFGNWRRLGLLVKTGFVAQCWWDGGAAAIPAGGAFSALPSLGAGGGGAATPVSAASNSNLGFLGWTATFGFRF
jgi:hypothetical protein